MNIGDECPNCGSIMSMEEADWGCHCYGYEEGDDLDDDEMDDDYISSDDIDDDDPNDSRNL